MKEQPNGKSKSGVSILLAIPAWSGSLNTLVIDSIFEAVRFADKQLVGVEIHPLWLQRGMVDRVRQQAHDKAVDEKHDYIMWWDDDIVAPKDTICRLFKHNVDIVSGMAFKRTEPFAMFGFKQVSGKLGDMSKMHHLPLNKKGTGLVEVDGTGTGCMLMRTDVVNGLEKPWWVWPTQGSEDLALCARLREKGIKVYIDTDIELGHLDFSPNVVDSNTHREWCFRMKEWVKQNPTIKSHPDFGQLKELIDGA